MIADEGLVDLGDAGPHLNGLDDALAAVVGPHPRRSERTRRASTPETIRRIARELAGADSAAVYGRVGVHTVVGGTVASWATDVLNTITGNLDRPGGAMWGLGGARSPEAAGRRRPGVPDRTVGEPRLATPGGQRRAPRRDPRRGDRDRRAATGSGR